MRSSKLATALVALSTASLLTAASAKELTKLSGADPKQPLNFTAHEGSRAVGEAKLEFGASGPNSVRYELRLAKRRARFEELTMEWEGVVGELGQVLKRTESIAKWGPRPGGGTDDSVLVAKEGELVRSSEGILGPEEKRQSTEGPVYEGLPALLLVARRLPEVGRFELPSVAWQNQEGVVSGEILLERRAASRRVYGKQALKVYAVEVDALQNWQGCLGDCVVYVTAEGEIQEVRSLESPLVLLRGKAPKSGKDALAVRDTLATFLAAMRTCHKATIEGLLSETVTLQGAEGRKVSRSKFLQHPELVRGITFGVDRDLPQELIAELIHVELTGKDSARACFGDLRLGRFSLTKTPKGWRVSAVPKLL